MNTDLSIVQGLNAWREILEQEYCQIEKDGRKSHFVKLQAPYDCDDNEPDDDREHRFSRHEVAKEIKHSIRTFLIDKVGSCNIKQKEYLIQLFSAKDKDGRGSIRWEDFIDVLSFSIQLRLTRSNETLLKKHLKIENCISYLKFIDGLYKSKLKKLKLIPTKDFDRFKISRERQNACKELKTRAHDDRTIRFLKLIAQRATVYGLQKRKSMIETLSQVFHSICTQDRRELGPEQLFMVFEACLDVRIDPREQQDIFQRLVEKDSIDFDQLLECLYRYEIIPPAIPCQGSTFQALRRQDLSDE